MYTDVDTTNFFTDNYIIIILIAVIIVMTIIGYIADKKDFGKKDKDVVKKDKNNKKDKKKKGKEEVQPVDIGQEILAENNEEFVDNVQPDVVPEDTNIIDSFEMPTDLDPVSNDVVTPVEPLDETSVSNDNLEGVNPVELPIEESNVEMVQEPTIEPVSLENNSNENQYDNSTNIEETNDNSWDTNDVTDEVATSPVDMELDTNASSEDFKLPNIENLDDQLIENADDEDVWKF